MKENTVVSVTFFIEILFIFCLLIKFFAYSFERKKKTISNSNNHILFSKNQSIKEIFRIKQTSFMIVIALRWRYKNIIPPKIK